MGAAILTHRLAQRGIPAVVRSAGWLGAGEPAPPEVAAALARVDVTGDPSLSRVVDPAEVASADLVLAMERQHVRKVVALDPDAWPRTFTLKELVRRAAAHGARGTGESMRDWLAAMHAGRTSTSMMGASRDDDVDDPFGRRARAYVRTVEELDDLVGRLVGLAWPASAV
jgi:protein-tyrosine phosphatase